MAKTAYVLLAEGFEELEATAPLDILRRLEVEAVAVGVSSKEVRGSHGLLFTADATLNRLKGGTPDAVILPGGMPGAKNLDANPFVRELILRCAREGKLVCAICAAPMVLGRLGLLEGKRAVCYPGYEEHLAGALLQKDSVVRDGQFITASGAGAAADFAFEIGAALAGEVKAAFVRRGMLFAPKA